MKPLLLLAILLFWNENQAQRLHDDAQGYILFYLDKESHHGPPHRFIGLYYSAYRMAPHRGDYAADYFTAWTMCGPVDKSMVEREEGVIPLAIIKAANKFPNNKRLQELRANVTFK